MLVNNNNTKKHHEKNNYNEIADIFNPLYNNPGFNNISGLGDDGDDALVSDFFNETKDWGDDNDTHDNASSGLKSDIINPYTY
ncbi:unnamed protein product [Rhizophagus irregularis]|uniref:Uncharacterized protein n=1 Tax=Rhizophagus irregularis TaxID=588596 RepID=A0A916E765_9GLOM|nr:unnamed protein product [Rhizophagus irregularis]CAB5359877.1 unnamed protein product [Rhizophagus irregularis]